ncbi:hypothetical protein N9240_01635, partial [Akkermansiaceae bacterium]|nr:hypothetical protein [Akkermansiaceae bacterium]
MSFSRPLDIVLSFFQPKRVLRMVAFSLLLCGLWVSGAERPNIIFIFADDWGYGDIGKHGSTFCET